MNKIEKIEDLRRFLAVYGLPPDRPVRALGVAALDRLLGGGLSTGSLHEVLAGDWSAGGFAACLAIRAAEGRPLFWVRPDYEALEYGALYPQGLAELGGSAENLFLVKTANAEGALAAANDILGCAHVGALILEISGRPLDLVASRRLSFLAAEKGVTAILLRPGADESVSAAQTRWQVFSAPSDSADWGAPSFDAHLIRNRLGATGSFRLTWNPDNGLFQKPSREDYAPHPGLVAAAVFDRPVAQERRFAF